MGFHMVTETCEFQYKKGDTIMFYNSLNKESLQRIANIETGFRNYPAYAAYQIRSYTYDWHAGVHALEISRDGRIVNLFLFYPNYGGKIESFAVYGSNLQGHYNAMRSSMMAFGMHITSISMESGASDYVDVYIEY